MGFERRDCDRRCLPDRADRIGRPIGEGAGQRDKLAGLYGIVAQQRLARVLDPELALGGKPGFARGFLVLLLMPASGQSEFFLTHAGAFVIDGDVDKAPCLVEDHEFAQLVLVAPDHDGLPEPGG